MVNACVQGVVVAVTWAWSDNSLHRVEMMMMIEKKIEKERKKEIPSIMYFSYLVFKMMMMMNIHEIIVNVGCEREIKLHQISCPPGKSYNNDEDNSVSYL